MSVPPALKMLQLVLLMMLDLRLSPARPDFSQQVLPVSIKQQLMLTDISSILFLQLSKLATPHVSLARLLPIMVVPNVKKPLLLGSNLNRTQPITKLISKEPGG